MSWLRTLTAGPHGPVGESASATISNNGTLNIVAAANATAPGAVNAGKDRNTYLGKGIVQQASADYIANAAIANAGSLNITALADFNGGASVAKATVTMGTAIDQSAKAERASASIDNTGSISILAKAVADPLGTANAYVTASKGVNQLASDPSGLGPVSAAITNGTGASFDVGVLATAVADNAANAGGRLGVGIQQKASGGAGGGPSIPLGANASIDNNGAIGVEVGASATAAKGYAQATAGLTDSLYGGSPGIGILQSATGHSTWPLVTEPVSVSLANGTAGSIAIDVHATAVASIEGTANAFFNDGILQYASGDSASVGLNNSGSISVNGAAVATLSNGSPNAHTFFGGGLEQVAIAASSAHNTLTNAAGGSITLGGSASAYGKNGANAQIDGFIGLLQEAHENNSGSATDFLSNAGSVSVALSGVASASNGNATHNAWLNIGIGQKAMAGSTATASLENVAGGSMTVRLDSVALAKGDSKAEANALLYNFGGTVSGDYVPGIGIGQSVQADKATASLVNSGTVDVSVLAAAAADAFASAQARISNGSYGSGGGNAISQDVHGLSSGSASLANSGTMSVLVAADATGGTHAYANAVVTSTAA